MTVGHCSWGRGAPHDGVPCGGVPCGARSERRGGMKVSNGGRRHLAEAVTADDVLVVFCIASQKQMCYIRQIITDIVRQMEPSRNIRCAQTAGLVNPGLALTINSSLSNINLAGNQTLVHTEVASIPSHRPGRPTMGPTPDQSENLLPKQGPDRSLPSTYTLSTSVWTNQPN